jgi:hypothetical protein
MYWIINECCKEKSDINVLTNGKLAERAHIRIVPGPGQQQAGAAARRREMNGHIRTPGTLSAITAIMMTLAPTSGGAVGNYGVPYAPSQGYCMGIRASLTQSGDRIHVDGEADALQTIDVKFPCTNASIAPSFSIAVSYTLWKANGSSSSQCLSGAFTGWFYNNRTGVDRRGYARIQDDHGNLTGRDMVGCGPGRYNVGVHGYFWDGSTWRGGTVFSGWESMNTPDPPPPSPLH